MIVIEHCLLDGHITTQLEIDLCGLAMSQSLWATNMKKKKKNLMMVKDWVPLIVIQIFTNLLSILQIGKHWNPTLYISC